jgi:F-type H+-transporting ATPase subunit b
MSLLRVTDLLYTGVYAREASHAAGQAVVVDFDATALVQIFFFIVLLFILKPVLFEPMLKLFEEREKRILGAKLQARKLDEGSAGALSKYEAEMQRARTAGNAERDRLRADGVKIEAEILGKTRAATTQALEQGRKQLGEQVAGARATLRGDATSLANDLVGRVLGRQVQE